MCPPTRSEYEAPTGDKPKAVRVWLLGGFSVSVGSRIIEDNKWRLRKAATLVKLLALAPGHRLHREQAMDLLWPDLGKKAVSNNLRQALYAARKILARDREMSAHYLTSEEETLVLCPAVGRRRSFRGGSSSCPPLPRPCCLQGGAGSVRGRTSAR